MRQLKDGRTDPNELSGGAAEALETVRRQLTLTAPAILAKYEMELRLLAEQEEIAVRAIYRRGYDDRRRMTE